MEIPHLVSHIKILTVPKVETEPELSKTSMNVPMYVEVRIVKAENLVWKNIS